MKKYLVKNYNKEVYMKVGKGAYLRRDKIESIQDYPPGIVITMASSMQFRISDGKEAKRILEDLNFNEDNLST